MGSNRRSNDKDNPCSPTGRLIPDLGLRPGLIPLGRRCVTVVDVGVLPGFIAVILLFLIPPGPDMAYMLAVGLESGRRSALKAILGIGTGMSVYAAAVVIGVGKVAQSYPLLLDAVKIFGAAYLLWLAFVTIRNARRMTSGSSGVSAGRPYLRGVLVSLTNPKVILFFLAVLPQFMGDAESAGLQLAMLGTVNVWLKFCCTALSAYSQASFTRVSVALSRPVHC